MVVMWGPVHIIWPPVPQCRRLLGLYRFGDTGAAKQQAVVPVHPATQLQCCLVATNHLVGSAPPPQNFEENELRRS